MVVGKMESIGLLFGMAIWGFIYGSVVAGVLFLLFALLECLLIYWFQSRIAFAAGFFFFFAADITNRIIRKENFMIAMINLHILDFRLPFCLEEETGIVFLFSFLFSFSFSSFLFFFFLFFLLLFSFFFKLIATMIKENVTSKTVTLNCKTNLKEI